MADRTYLVLLVDDDQAEREAIQFSLRLEGLCVHVHTGGADLLADPDLPRAGCVVLSDSMGTVEGFALLRHLKARNIEAPFIMLSRHVTDRVRTRAIEAGVTAILEKPLMDNALRDNIRALMIGPAIYGANGAAS
jgi:two-component system, LuxR family, response regulator FixJ